MKAYIIMGDIMVFECELDDEKWIAEINSYNNYGAYIMANITARGSSIDIIIGNTEHYSWIALPIYEVSTTLASLFDVYWNAERLERLIGVVDAVTVATALSYIYENRDIFNLQSTKKLHF